MMSISVHQSAHVKHASADSFDASAEALDEGRQAKLKRPYMPFWDEHLWRGHGLVDLTGALIFTGSMRDEH